MLFIFIFIEETNQFKMFYKKTDILGSSHSQKFLKIAALKNFEIFTRKQLCWSLLQNFITGLL